MLVAIVNTASNFVYGLLGTLKRPDGVLDVAFFSSMDAGCLRSANGNYNGNHGGSGPL